MKSLRRKNSKVPTVSTASLPDIVFILLFFFMTVTTIKDNEQLVENVLPSASEVQKLDKKDRIIEVCVGKPIQELAAVLGNQPKIQLNKKLVKIDEVGSFLLAELAKKPDAIRNQVTVSLKIDKAVNLGTVADIKEELRKINLLKVSYTVHEGNTPNP